MPLLSPHLPHLQKILPCFNYFSTSIDRVIVWYYRTIKIAKEQLELEIKRLHAENIHLVSGLTAIIKNQKKACAVSVKMPAL